MNNLNNYGRIAERYSKGYVTAAQLQRFAKLGVLTEEQAQIIWEATQVQVIPQGIYRRMALAFMDESEKGQENLSANAGYFAKEYDQWQPGETYRAGKLLQYEGVALQVRQQVTAQAHQPPFSAGMTAIYIPYLVPDEKGVKTYKYGCSTKRGETFYGEDGKIYEHIAVDNPSNIYPPTPDLPAIWRPLEETER